MCLPSIGQGAFSCFVIATQKNTALVSWHGHYLCPVSVVSVLVSCNVIKNREICFTKGLKSRAGGNGTAGTAMAAPVFE